MPSAATAESRSVQILSLIRGFRERRVLRTDVKQALAQYCYDHFIDGTEIIYLDAGSTILYLAKLLAAKHPPNLTVITNDVIIAAELVNTDIHLIILGGQVQNSLGCIHGYIAEAKLQSCAWTPPLSAVWR